MANNFEFKDLRNHDRWCCWEEVTRGNSPKPTKIPFCPSLTKRIGARPNTPSDFGSYKDARRAKKAMGFDGVGFLLTENDPFVVMDIDDCRDPQTGKLKKFARRFIKQLDTYAEVSPSGRGVHIWVWTTEELPSINTGRIEVYFSRRYLTVTGDRLKGSPKTINERTVQLATIMKSELEKSLPVTPKKKQTITNLSCIVFGMEKMFNTKVLKP